MAALVDLVKIVVSNTGTGAIVLGAASPGFRGVEALVNGQSYSYSVQQGSNFEIGRGTYLSGTSQLVRAPLYSSAGGAAIALAPGAEVAFVALAEDFSEMLALIASLAAGTGATGILNASGAIAKGQLLNTAGGVVRAADCTVSTKYADAFALSTAADGEPVQFSPWGMNLGVAPAFTGRAYLSTAGTVSSTRLDPGDDANAGKISQVVGYAFAGVGLFFTPAVEGLL